MNTHAHLSGQISGQVSAQAVPQVSGPPQIGNSLARQMSSEPRNMDPELLSARKAMIEKIFPFIQKNSSYDWGGRLPEMVRRLEDRMFRTASKATYMNLLRDDCALQSAIKNIINSNQSTRQSAPSSTHSMMIPTPGMAQKGYTNTAVSGVMEIHNIPAVSTAAIAQTTAVTGNFSSSTNVGNKASYNISDVSNGHKHQAANFGLSGGGSLVSSMATSNMPRQLTQMIPTPGYTNPSMNSECSTGTSFSGTVSTMVTMPQQQNKYVGSQNSHILYNMGGHASADIRSNIQQKSPSYRFPNGVANGGSGSIGSNMHLNGSATSEGFHNAPSYGTYAKPLQHEFDQHRQSKPPTASLLQQVLPSTTDGSITAAEMTGYETFQTSGSSVLSAMSNLNSVRIHTTPRTNSDVLNQQASLQSMQRPPNVMSQMLDHQQNMNFQSSQSTNEQMLHSQQQMQQFHQHPNQSYVHAQFVQNQHQLHGQQQGVQNQPYMSTSILVRQPSLTSNFGDNLIPGNTIVTQSELLFQQPSQRAHLPELQSPYHQNAPLEDHSKDVQSLNPLTAEELPIPVSDGLQQFFQLRQHADEFTSKLGTQPNGSQTDELLQSQWHPQPLQKLKMSGNSSSELLKEEVHQRILEQEETQQPHNSLEGCMAGSAVMFPQYTGGAVHVAEDPIRIKNYHDQCRWLLFLHHARACPFPKGQCKESNCTRIQELVVHMRSCNNESCSFRFCSSSKKLIKHYESCEAASCPVCVPVRERIIANHKVHVALSDTVLLKETKTDTSNMTIDNNPTETTDDRQPSSKRMKIQNTSSPQVTEDENSRPDEPPGNQPYTIYDAQPQECEQSDMICAKSDVADAKLDQSLHSGQESLTVCQNSDAINSTIGKRDLDSHVADCVNNHVKDEILVVEMEIDQPNIEVKQEAGESPADQMTSSKSGKPKIKGVSLTELFTPEQIREHIMGLRQWVGQSKAKAEKNQAMEHSMSENSCQLCAVEKLTFEPPPIYCSPCGARIKRNAMYYTIGSGDTRHCFCIPCYNEARGDSIEVDGSTFPKARLEKKRNDEDTEEWWVQCDKCEAWQHQICALFNGRRNNGGEAEYTCPNCYIQEIEMGERKPLPQSAVLGARDLPKTILSDHIEQRLFRRLKQERSERARNLGKSYDEVPGAEGLVVRVVSSVDKKLEVKQQFLELFQEENYPKEFPYKSKAVLLFQKIEGVEVCLFGMYVQEFGSECSYPNQRRVYLSYLDSVKYFRPEIKTVSGEALRTLVYHEILIGYLDYCKKRGFTSCYIWACPPLKGEDYILYCHPEIQKTPKSDKLREWYLSMLRKASRENIVVELTNLYDHFFVQMGECKAKVTAARLPYFDGDYWPGAAEDMINQLRQEEDSRKQQKKGKTKNTLTKRALKAAGQSDLSGNASKDFLLMQKLGETICPMKEDFIMVHLQHCCKHCCALMVSGTRWVCSKCKNFQLCDQCYEEEQRIEETDRHPIYSREKHMLYPDLITDVNPDTKDKDEILESEFFDTRQAFLSLCQGNHYQYDTLRRAKHSSMMVLYHLHNPTAPAFVTQCHVCHHDIEAGQGWRCESCPDFDVCNVCYKKGGIDHPHKLTNHPSTADRDAQNKEARQKRVVQLRKMLDLLVHASQCRNPHCQYPNCRKVKGLFRHGIQCKVRVGGGCALCKKMWYLLQIHARACKESQCNVPRCRDLKEHLRRLQQQSDSRRRAAVMEMMRQRAAEVAGNPG